MTKELGVWKAEDCALVLIDYQREMFEVIRSETNADMVELHARLLAKTAKAFDMPIVLSTVGVGIGFRAYPGWAAASYARRAFLKAIRPQASWSKARWFSSFLHQRMRMPRLRFSQEWVASTIQRRARQPGVWALSLISSPRARMCGV